MIRRLVLALLLLVAGCGDGATDVAAEDVGTTTTDSTAEPTETTAAAMRTGPPAILVASGSEIIRVQGEATELVGAVDGEATVAYGDGVSDIQAVQVDGRLVAMLHGSPMQLDPGAPGAVSLFDVVNIDDVPHALYGVLERPPDLEPTGPLILGSITGEERRNLGTAFAVEYTTFAGSIGGGRVSTSAYSDLTEDVGIWQLDGEREPNAWSPTRDIEYNEPPMIWHAILAPDGATLAWLSGPDASARADEPEQVVGSWEVVVADLEGDERHRLPLEGAPKPVHLDYDGDRVLVSREDAPALLIDLSDGTTRALPVAGTATFDG